MIVCPPKRVESTKWVRVMVVADGDHWWWRLTVRTNDCFKCLWLACVLFQRPYFRPYSTRTTNNIKGKQLTLFSQMSGAFCKLLSSLDIECNSLVTKDAYKHKLLLQRALGSLKSFFRSVDKQNIGVCGANETISYVTQRGESFALRTCTVHRAFLGRQV